MFYVSEIQTEAPCRFQTPLQRQVYAALEKLQIPFERVDGDEAIAMEDCVAIDEKLQINMVKTLFLCNRQQTDFYLSPSAASHFAPRILVMPLKLPAFLLRQQKKWTPCSAQK